MMRAANKQIIPPARASLPSAAVKKSRLTWWLWLIPAGALAVCAWFVFRDYIATGPLITIYFQDTEGLEAENTMVSYRGANVGQVKSVELAKDGKSVKVRARLAGSARGLARRGSEFWIVQPEVKLGAISGLRTIISGEYIAVQPGTGPPTNIFIGMSKQPIAREPDALKITLMTTDLGTMQEQSPIFYRGIQVGEILYYQLTSDARGVAIHARIWPEYAPLVRTDSKFWNAGGLDFRFGLFKGMQVSAESPRTLISGGIEFATPTDFHEPATNGTVFTLNEKPDEKWKTWTPAIALQLQKHAASQTNSLGDSLSQLSP